MFRWIFILLLTLVTAFPQEATQSREAEQQLKNDRDTGVVSRSSSEGQEKAFEKPQGYVSDFARVVDVAGRMEIEDYLGALERGTGVQVAVVTVSSLNGEPIEDFTNSLYRKWGIGKKGSNEGLMVLFAIQDRKMRIEVGYGLEPILPDGVVGSVQRSLREELRAAKYGDAILKCVRSLGSRIQQAKGVAVSDLPPPSSVAGRGRPGPPQVDIPIWAIFLGLFLIFFVLPRLFAGGHSHGRRYRGGYGPGPFIGGGGWGGGGFGGSSGGGDSGGGFGGFGGGDSGGGGASSDW